MAKKHNFGNKNETSPYAEEELFIVNNYSKHANDNNKFSCQALDQDGCGSSTNSEQSSCTNVDVHENGESFRDSQECAGFVKRISKCRELANQLKPSIQKGEEEITEDYDMFVKDVHLFEDEIIDCVKKFAEKTIKNGNKIKLLNIQNMNDLETQRQKAGTDIITMHNAVDAQIGQPKRLSGATQQKSIQEIECKLGDIERRLAHGRYHFEREAEIDRVLETVEVLGTFQARKENDYTGATFITDPSASPASSKFVEQFQNKMKEIGISINKIDASKVSSLKQDAVLILVCNTPTRIIANLEECLGYIGNGQLTQTIALVLHVGRNMLTASTKDGILDDGSCEKLNKVLGIVDMTFEKNVGIHPNDLNNNAYKQLTTLLGKRRKKKKCNIQ